MKKKIAILGSTGSIGVNTIDVVCQNPDKFDVIGLTAGCNIDLLEKQIKIVKPAYAAISSEEDAHELASRVKGLGVEIFHGVDGIVKVATMPEVDTVLSAIVGAAGLIPTISAIRKGKKIALANKETLVTAGGLIEKETNGEAVMLPVDSEHSAIFQSLNGEKRKDIKKLIITASGGPFRGFSLEQLQNVKPSDALKHPNWDMGRKISIDSATLMNKGLEVIEAKWLFDVTVDQIEVVVHPQSIIHSLVEFVDGSVIAQLGLPDMRLPISYALHYPERSATNLKSLNLAEIKTLTFEEPNTDNFPCLRYAFDALKIGGTMPTVLNAANEVVVNAFLDNKISFMQIPEIIHSTMESHNVVPTDTLEIILEADRWAREKSEGFI